VVKSQGTDIIDLLLQLIKHPNGIHRACRNRKSGFAVLSTAEIQWATTKFDGVWKYLHNLFAVQPDFLYSVSRDFIRTCRTPILVLPDDVPGHPLQTSIDVASLAPNAEITVYPWKEPAELKQRTIDRVRRFLQAHVPMRAAAH
jgi:hypothetical protein